MNKYDGELKYSVVSYRHYLSAISIHKDDLLVIEYQANRDLRTYPPSRIVAWCTSKEAAYAARRLLSGECK